MSGDRVEVGRCRCPICGSTAARLRVSAKQLAYVTCNACNAQVFARSDRSDELLRGTVVHEDAAPSPSPSPSPQPQPQADDGMSWGIFGRRRP